MEKKKFDWIISIVREEMMTANPPGKGGGVGGQVDPTGKDGPPGFDPVMKFDGRSKIARRLPSPYRNDLIKKKKKSTS